MVARTVRAVLEWNLYRAQKATGRQVRVRAADAIGSVGAARTLLAPRWPPAAAPPCGPHPARSSLAPSRRPSSLRCPPPPYQICRRASAARASSSTTTWSTGPSACTGTARPWRAGARCGTSSCASRASRVTWARTAPCSSAAWAGAPSLDALRCVALSVSALPAVPCGAGGNAADGSPKSGACLRRRRRPPPALFRPLAECRHGSTAGCGSTACCSSRDRPCSTAPAPRAGSTG